MRTQNLEKLSRIGRFGLLGLAVLAAGACAAGIDPPADPPTVKITGGKFAMGGGQFDPCNGSNVTDVFTLVCPDKVQSELTRNWVEVKPFWIDEIEVTNFRYRHCVALDECKEPEAQEAGDPKKPDGHHKGYYGKDAFKDYPVIGVTWEQAKNYCERQGGRLPTEAEWEFVATDGGQVDTTEKLRGLVRECDEGKGEVAFGSCSKADILEAGSGAKDVTEAGVHDMAASVQEWVADTFDYLAYCKASASAGYTEASPGKFPRFAGNVPPAEVRGPEACLDAKVDENTSAEYPGNGCNQRLTECAGQCSKSWKTGTNRSTAQSVADFADTLCRQRVGSPPEGTDCTASGDAACAAVAEADRPTCVGFCACNADQVTLAGTDGGDCLHQCMTAYIGCATTGLANGYEAVRGACVDPAAGFACLDTQPNASASSKQFRMRPTCLPRGTEAAPFAGYEGQKNVPIDPSKNGALDGRHVIRGANYQEDDACVLRATRRETWQDVGYSGVVGFRCAYDSDPAAAQ